MLSMKSLFILLLLSAGIYATWGDYIAPAITQHLPREMMLTNKDGDDISITLIKKDEKNVYFRKKGSPIVHSYEIAQLNFLSRCRIKLYPKYSSIPSPMPTPKPILKATENPARQHLNSMYEKREDLKKQVRLLQTEMRREAKKAKLIDMKMSKESNMSNIQTISIEIMALKVEINDLTYKIEDLEYRYPHLVNSK